MPATQCEHCGGPAPAWPPKPPGLGIHYHRVLWDLSWELADGGWKAKHRGTTIRVSRSHASDKEIYCALERDLGTWPHVVRLTSGYHMKADELALWLRWALEAITGAALGNGGTR